MKFLMYFGLFLILLKNKYIEAALAGFKAKKELKKMTERDSVTVIIQMIFLKIKTFPYHYNNLKKFSKGFFLLKQ